MRASLVYGMGCLAVLLLPAAFALSAVPDELTTTIRQGELVVIHLVGAPNETLTLSTDRIGALGQAITVPLNVIKLDQNGTATYAFRLQGELGAVGNWEFRAANATTFVKVRYRVDWDPVFLLEKEAANVALQEAFWLGIRNFVLWGMIALSLTWVSMRLWHALSHVRHQHVGKKVAHALGLVKKLASVTEMGMQVATTHPLLANRTGLLQQRHRRKALTRVLEENLERDMSILRERNDALTLEATYRDRILSDSPDDPLVRDFVEEPGALEEAIRAEFSEFIPKEEDDGASS